MKYFSIPLIIFLSLLSGCRSFDLIQHLQAIPPNTQLLPALTPIWDDAQFQMLYGQTEVMDGDLLSLSPDVRALDLQLIYDQMVRGGISTIQGGTFGYAVLSLDLHTRPAPLSPLLTAGQILTLTVPSWFGVPYKYTRTDCIVVVDIVDSRNQTLGKYTGSGHGKSATSLYKDGDRLGPVQAFSEALKHVQSHIAQDVERLEAALQVAGPIEE